MKYAWIGKNKNRAEDAAFVHRARDLAARRLRLIEQLARAADVADEQEIVLACTSADGPTW